MTAARLLFSIAIGVAGLTIQHAEAASVSSIADAAFDSPYLQVAEARGVSSSIPRLETLTVTELPARNAAAFSADVFRAAKSDFSATARPIRLMAAGNLQLDIVLMFAVVLGLVAFQLRRAQDSLQRSFSNV